MTSDDAADRQRLQRIAAQSADADAVFCECVYGGRVVRFEVSALELQHLGAETLWERYFIPAWKALNVPAPVVADTIEEGSLVGVVGNP